jgi:hypothetical protein
MRSTAKSSGYFSAYPLKALEKATSSSRQSEASPYLKALLSDSTKQSGVQLRVLPMKNPYMEKIEHTTIRTQLIKNVESTDKEWFNNYE